VHTPLWVYSRGAICLAPDLNGSHRVPFGVKHLGAACGVMITGMCGHTTNLGASYAEPILL